MTQDARFRRYLTKFGIIRSSRILYQHTVRYHNSSDLELYSLLRPGEDSIHALEEHNRPDLMRYRRDVFDDKYARLRGDRPCKTIVAHLAKDGNGYIHPTQVRSLSFREAARVQSFHDGFVFCGSPSEQWIQSAMLCRLCLPRPLHAASAVPWKGADGVTVQHKTGLIAFSPALACSN